MSACTAAPQGAAYPVEDLPPQPYGYQYGVEDAETNSSFQKSESQVTKQILRLKLHEIDFFRMPMVACLVNM